MLNLKYKGIIIKSGPLIQTDGTLFIPTEPLITNLQCQHSFIPRTVPWPHPPNQLFTPYFKQNN